MTEPTVFDDEPVQPKYVIPPEPILLDRRLALAIAIGWSAYNLALIVGLIILGLD